MAWHTYLSHSFKQTDNKYCREASSLCKDRSQQRQHRRPGDAEQHQCFAADLLSEGPSKDLSRCVTIEECAKNETLGLLIPVECVRLQHKVHCNFIAST